MPATKLSDFNGYLAPNQAEAIFNETAKISVFQQLIRQVPLGTNGEAIPVVTTKPTASWVAEGAQKPVTNLGVSTVTMQPKKLAAIWVTSAEVVRANPGGITDTIRQGLADAFATAFDYAAGFGLGGNGTGTGPFTHNLSETTKTTLLGQSTQAKGGIYGDLVGGLKTMVSDGKKITAWALDSTLEPLLWGATDSTGRPLYLDIPTRTDQTAPQPGVDVPRAGQLLNRPSLMGDGLAHSNVAGFYGDFTKAAWGVVGGINYRVSTETAVTVDGQLTSLWEHNLVALLAEAEYGFVMQDPSFFGKLLISASPIAPANTGGDAS